MPSHRDIRRRIKSVSSTAQITKAMQMVAASKMRKAQQAALAGRPFAHLLYRDSARGNDSGIGDFTHPLLEVREVRKRAVILISTERACAERSTATCSAWPPSSTPIDGFHHRRRKAAQVRRPHRPAACRRVSPMPTRRDFAEARAIAAFAHDLFLKREVDQVQIVATRFVNTLTQQPLCH